MEAIVLSGGGNRGAMHVGALRALFERGVRPDLIVGASVGAINGAFVAGDPTPVAVERLAEIWRGLRREDVFPGSLVDRALQLLRHRDRLYDPSRLRALVERHAPARTFEELAVRLVVVAVALDEGREVWFDAGPLAPAVMASAAIPGIFPPVVIGGVRYVDGGVVNNAPLSAAVAYGAERIYVVDVGLPCRCKRARNVLDIIAQSLALQGSQRLEADLARYADRSQIVYIPLPCQLDVWFSDFSHTCEMMADAYSLARAALDGRPEPAVWLDGRQGS